LDPEASKSQLRREDLGEEGERKSFVYVVKSMVVEGGRDLEAQRKVGIVGARVSSTHPIHIRRHHHSSNCRCHMERVKFWEDNWLGPSNLGYSVLGDLCDCQ
jgi:hypothetical protein